MFGSKAFTLMELMVVVVVIGLIVAFAMPNYTKSYNKTVAREAVNNLRTIAAAEEAYKATQGSYYFPSFAFNVANLNTNLGLNILTQNGLNYACSSSVGAAGGCVAVKTGDWTYIIEPPDWTITCASIFSGHPCPNGVP
jgi:prepilin-type N-terminal cleavage/methylation domain-containing protein